MAIVGTGTYTYELVEDWAKLPAGWTLGQTGIVTDARDRVYLFNRSEHPLIVLDRDGTFFTSWGEGVLSSAHGMFIDQQENIYLPVINSHVVLKYSAAGNLLMTLGTWDQPSETGWSGKYQDPVKQAAGPFHRGAPRAATKRRPAARRPPPRSARPASSASRPSWEARIRPGRCPQSQEPARARPHSRSRRRRLGARAVPGAGSSRFLPEGAAPARRAPGPARVPG